jgi:broad specificity phosphatase PhoE
LWDEAVKIERAKQRFDRTGADGRKFSKAKVDKAWRKAVCVFEQVCREEKAWQRCCLALEVFRPDGQVNDRQWAQAELQAAVAALNTKAWAKVLRQLHDERTLTFLDRLHEELTAAEPDQPRREALVALWRWRRTAAKCDQQGSSATGVMGEVLMGLVRGRLGENWQEAYRRVSQVLKRVLRASSAVECVNSVVRMHQSRHKNLTQPLLDLKRLFFNCRGFLEGKRKGRCPYQLLGLILPTYDPWALLQMDPATLEQLLSSSGFPL